MRCGLADRRTVLVVNRPRIWGRVPQPPPSPPFCRGWRALPTGAVVPRASVCKPAAPEVVDTFGFSALASIRPTSTLLHTLQCPRTSDHLLPPLHRWLCSIRRRTAIRPSGTPCRTAHRSESRAISSLCRVTLQDPETNNASNSSISAAGADCYSGCILFLEVTGHEACFRCPVWLRLHFRDCVRGWPRRSRANGSEFPKLRQRTSGPPAPHL